MERRERRREKANSPFLSEGRKGHTDRQSASCSYLVTLSEWPGDLHSKSLSVCHP